MRKVSTSLSLLAASNLAAVLSFACTGADNSDGPPQTVFTVSPPASTPVAQFPTNVAVQPVAPVNTSPTTTTSSAAPTSAGVSPTSAATTSLAPTSTATSTAPTSTPANTSVDNPLDNTSDDEETTTDEETSVGNPNGDPGIPIDADGYFPSNSNVMGFQGSWYCFADDVNETSCVQDEPPYDATTLAMCLTGSTTERETEDDYTAWGAGIGASLNDQGGKKQPFDAEAKGIKGFKFTVTGDFDGATLQLLVPLTNKDSEDGPPEYNMTKPGTYSVEFDEIVRPEYTESDDTADPEALYALKWQIKGGDTTSSYNFCITDVEPL